MESGGRVPPEVLIFVMDTGRMQHHGCPGVWRADEELQGEYSVIRLGTHRDWAVG